MENKEPIKPQNQEDVNPGSQLDKILNQEEEQPMPETNGTGSNKPVPTASSVIIESSEDEAPKKEDNGTH